MVYCNTSSLVTIFLCCFAGLVDCQTFTINWSDSTEDLVLLSTKPCAEFFRSNICITSQSDPGVCMAPINHVESDQCLFLFDGKPGITYKANLSAGMIYKTLKPSPVSNLMAHHLTVTWKKPMNTAFDTIILCANGTGGECHSITNSTSESYNFPNLVPGALYTITAQVFSNGVGSDILTTRSYLKPLPVTFLNAADSTVRWKNPDNIEFDTIEVCAIGINGSCYYTTNNTTESYNFTNLVPGASYNIAVQVFSNGVGSGAQSLFHTLKPLPVLNLTATGSTVSWKNPHYSIFDTIKLCANGTNEICQNITNGMAESYNFSNLVPGASYVITAKVFSNGVSSDRISVSLNIGPSNPQNVLAVGDLREAKVSWTYPRGHVNDGFEILCEPPTASCNGILSLAVNVFSYTIKDILHGQLYNFSVRSRSNNELSDWVFSNPVFSNPLAPTGLKAQTTGLSRTSVELSWTSPKFTRLVGYGVSACSKRQQYCLYDHITNVTSHTVNGLVSGETYNFTVQSRTDNNTLSENGNTVSITLEPSPADKVQLLFVDSDAMGWTWRNGSGFNDGWDLSLNGIAEYIDSKILTINYTRLNPDTKYTFSIRSFVSAGDNKKFSDWRNTTSTTDEADSGPAIIGNVTSINDSLTVSWSEPIDPHGVIVYYVVTLHEFSDSSCLSKTVVNCTKRKGKEGIDYQQKLGGISFGCLTDSVIRSCDQVIRHTFQKLKPHTSYTVQIHAVNSKEPAIVNHTIKTSQSGKPCENQVSFGFCQARLSFDREMCGSSKWRQLCCDYCHTITKPKHCNGEELPVNVCRALASHSPDFCSGFSNKHSQSCCAYCRESQN